MNWSKETWQSFWISLFIGLILGIIFSPSLLEVKNLPLNQSGIHIDDITFCTNCYGCNLKTLFICKNNTLDCTHSSNCEAIASLLGEDWRPIKTSKETIWIKYSKIGLEIKRYGLAHLNFFNFFKN